MAQPRITPQQRSANEAGLLNAIRETMDPNYLQYIPEATAESVLDVGRTVNSLGWAKEQFANALAYKFIPEILVKSPKFNSPLDMFIGDDQPLGDMQEEVYVGLNKTYEYDPDYAGDAKDLYKREKPDLSVAVHRRNRANMYPISIDDIELSRALTTEGGITRLVDMITSSVHTKAKLDEHDLMLARINATYKIGGGQLVQVEDVGEIIEEVSVYANDSYYPNTFNEAGLPMTRSIEDLVLIINSRALSKIDKKVLASAMNLEKAQLDVNYTVVHSNAFADDNLQAVLVSKQWFHVHTHVREMRVQEHASALTRKFFYHVHQTISNSPFEPFIAFTYKIPEKLKGRLTVTPFSTVLGGRNPKEQTFIATIEGFKSPDFEVGDFELDVDALIDGNRVELDTVNETYNGIVIETHEVETGKAFKVRIEDESELIPGTQFNLRVRAVFDDGSATQKDLKLEISENL